MTRSSRPSAESGLSLSLEVNMPWEVWRVVLLFVGIPLLGLLGMGLCYCLMYKLGWGIKYIVGGKIVWMKED